MTVSAMAERWTLEVESRKGRDVRETVAAQRAAFDLALDVVTGSSPLSESWVRRVHEVACAAQETYTVYTASGPQEQPLPKGVYKTYPNHVEFADGSLHAYAPVDRVGDEMHRLLDELRSPSFEQAHAVLQAAYAHHALTMIRPFADGNGHVARVPRHAGADDRAARRRRRRDRGSRRAAGDDRPCRSGRRRQESRWRSRSACCG